MYWQPLIFIAYVAALPALFVAWAALEIKIHPTKYRSGDNTMSNTELSATIRELRELRRMADELAADIETLTDTIKEHMTAAGVDTLTGTDYKVTWCDVSSRRLDSAALKRDHAELYSQYSRETISKRFTLA